MPGWALTLAPNAVAKAEKRLTELRSVMSAADDAVDENRQIQLIQYANAMGTTALVLVSLAVSSSAAPIVLAGSVLFGSGMILVRGIRAPETIDGVELALNVGFDRLGTALDTVDADSYISSGSTAQFTQVGGRLLAMASLAFAWTDFALTSGNFQASTVERQRLQEALAEREGSLRTSRHGSVTGHAFGMP